MVKSFMRSGSKRMLLNVAAIPLVSIGVGLLAFAHFATAPHHIDRDLFTYVSLPYKEESVLYSYADGDRHALVFARVSPDQAREIISKPSDIFPDCQGQADQCTSGWVSGLVLMPSLITGMQRGSDMQAAKEAHEKTVTKGSFCTFSPNIMTLKNVSVEHTICVNPANGYLMYSHLMP